MPCLLRAQNTDDSTGNKWSGTLEADYYFIPEDEIHPTITCYADYKSLHFEVRYNYEDFNTASVFAGKTWEKDGDFYFSITPMIGLAVGNTNGILPGFECSATFSKLSLYSENEYMFDFTGKEGNFFYSWTQLGDTIIKNMQAGVAAESFRLYKTKFDVQKGVYLEYNLGKFLFDVYHFNPFSKYNYTVASIAYNF